MKQSNIIMPTELQSLEALDKLKEALTNMGQLRQNLTNLRDSGFILLPESRRLKIQPEYRDKLSDPYYNVPSLKLSGEWLKRAGFEQNQHVRVIALHQLLIVCPEQVPALPKRLRDV